MSFEWDYTNVVTLLRRAGLPIYAEERSEKHPLVVIGGAVTFVNPEPLALFADVVTAGEGESLVPDLVEAMRGGGTRADVLRRLAGKTGFYIPSFYTPRYDDAGRLAAMDPLRRHRRAAGRAQGRRQDRPSGSIRRTPRCSRPTPSSARAS